MIGDKMGNQKVIAPPSAKNHIPGRRPRLEESLLADEEPATKTEREFVMRFAVQKRP